MANVLVTGGAGYIGSHTCKALKRAGFTPITFDDLSNGHEQAVRWGPFERGDILDAARLAEVLARWRPLAVMHFAGLIEVGLSVKQPARFRRANVEGSRILLEAMAATGCKHIVFSSSAAVYGEPEETPIPETHPLRPLNPYGEGKAEVESLLAENTDAGRLRYVALRYFNAAGADPEGETGERHQPETHALPLAILAALGRGPAFRILGGDYPTPDGTAVRDYVHVSDLAQGHVRALQYLLDGGESVALNLGTGVGVSVAELVRSVGRVLGRSVPSGEAPRRAGDPAVLVAAPGRAKALLDWQAEIEDFDCIVRTAAAWHSKCEGVPV